MSLTEHITLPDCHPHNIYALWSDGTFKIFAAGYGRLHMCTEKAEALAFRDELRQRVLVVQALTC